MTDRFVMLHAGVPEAGQLLALAALCHAAEKAIGGPLGYVPEIRYVPGLETPVALTVESQAPAGQPFCSIRIVGGRARKSK